MTELSIENALELAAGDLTSKSGVSIGEATFAQACAAYATARLQQRLLAVAEEHLAASKEAMAASKAHQELQTKALTIASEMKLMDDMVELVEAMSKVDIDAVNWGTMRGFLARARELNAP